HAVVGILSVPEAYLKRQTENQVNDFVQTLKQVQIHGIGNKPGEQPVDRTAQGKFQSDGIRFHTRAPYLIEDFPGLIQIYLIRRKCVEQIRVQGEIHRQPEPPGQRYSQVGYDANQACMLVMKIAIQGAGLIGCFFQEDAEYFSLLVTEEQSQGVSVGAEILVDQSYQFRQVPAGKSSVKFLVERAIGLVCLEFSHSTHDAVVGKMQNAEGKPV